MITIYTNNESVSAITVSFSYTPWLLYFVHKNEHTANICSTQNDDTWYKPSNTIEHDSIITVIQTIATVNKRKDNNHTRSTNSKPNITKYSRWKIAGINVICRMTNKNTVKSLATIENHKIKKVTETVTFGNSHEYHDLCRMLRFATFLSYYKYWYL